MIKTFVLTVEVVVETDDDSYLCSEVRQAVEELVEPFDGVIKIERCEQV